MIWAGMHMRLILPALASLFVTLPACGDKGDDETSAASSTTTTPEGTTMDQLPTTSGDDTTTGPVDPSTTTTVDPSTSTDPDPSTTGGEETGDPGDCKVAMDDADEDADGVANNVDNCACDANPNQLDFDGNKIGNVCDQPLTFTLADGAPPEFNKLATTAKAGMSIVSCMFPVDLVVLNGEVQVSLDDTGTAKFYAKRLNFADTPELECDLTIVKVTLIIQDFFSDGPDPFVVGFPFTLPDHAAGTISGQTDSPHSILVSGVINVTSSTNEGLAMPGENPINMVPGAFPTGLASVINKGDQVSVVFDDNDSVIFMQTTDSGIEIELRGLKGTLRLTK